MDKTPTPNEIRMRLPPGHISLKKQWKDSPLHSEIIKIFSSVKFHLDPTFDAILPDHSVLYLQGFHHLSNINFDYLKAQQEETTVLVFSDCNSPTGENFERIQSTLLDKFSSVIPISNVIELSLYLQDLLHQLSVKSTAHNEDTDEEYGKIAIEVLLSVPRLGPKKASLLMDAFKGIQPIAYASIEDLVPIVGVAAATQVHKFFNEAILK